MNKPSALTNKEFLKIFSIGDSRVTKGVTGLPYKRLRQGNAALTEWQVPSGRDCISLRNHVSDWILTNRLQAIASFSHCDSFVVATKPSGCKERNIH